MKTLITIMLCCFVSVAICQLESSGRWKLEKVTFKDQLLFDRSAGPQSSESRITVVYQTSDENFNKQMNKQAFDYFSASEITFVNDTMFIRTSTSITNGSYRNDIQFGKYTLSGQDVLNLDIKNAQEPTVQSYKYTIENDLLTLERTDLIAVYKKHPNKIDNAYNQPWKNENVPIIIDAYYLNEIQWDELIKDKKVHGIIHKFGQGLRVDTKYNVRKHQAKKMNLLWGSYILGSDEDPIEQAEFYYKHAEYDSTELYCLDLEDVNAKGMMSLKQAEQFIKHWHQLTGRYPVLYCNKNVLQQIDKKYGRRSVFAKCPLWYARFRNEIPDWEPKTWNQYTLWQFSSEINCEKTGECLYNLSGVAHDMDINVFNGTIHELRLTWPRL